MKIRSLLLTCLFNLFISAGVYAQNLFNEKIENVCNITNYCMDCGTPKATCDAYTLNYISELINHRYNFNGGAGTITFQILVDSTGFSCVLSHTDVTHSALTYDLIRFLNGCLWHPAIVNGKPVAASVIVVFTIANSRIAGQMKRMDLTELEPPGAPVIYNQQYTYSNPLLNTYNFKVWTKYNSPLPDNISQTCVIDKSDTLWYATEHGLVRFDGNKFYAVNEYNSPLNSTTTVHAMAVDKDNNKWMNANKAMYMYNYSGWRLFDSTHFVVSSAYRIVTNPSGEIFFTSNKGLLIVRNEKVRLITKDLILQLPSNNVYFAYYDSRQCLWIGTDKGSIMIDKKKKATVFNRTNSPLKNVCITNITEDENGNLYFSVRACNKPAGDNDEEGIIVKKADGTWLHYNDKNSGMPSNQVNSILYDRFEHVLWVGTHQSGLVRFDLKNGWENYNNTNTTIPGFDIYQMAQDSRGNIYASTANGMLRINKK
jgi:ligand-binding sensor domain-containing protein